MRFLLAIAFVVFLERSALGTDEGRLAGPLPDLAALLKEADANQKIAEQRKEQYAGARVEEQTMAHKGGKVITQETNEFSFFFLKGVEVSRLVKKNGKALPEMEEKKEREKFEREVRELTRGTAAKKAKEDDEMEVGVEAFLRVGQTSNLRRENLNGRSSFAVDFVPNPKFKARTDEEKMAQKLAGTIWIDEKARMVARIAAHFVDSMSFGGVLAKIQKGSTFVIEQTPFNEEAWLPLREEGRIAVRVMMVKGIEAQMVSRYSDYKKFDPASVQEMAAPMMK